MKILITGGTGFLGKNLALNLIRSDHEITLLVRSGSQLPHEIICAKNIKIVRRLNDTETIDFISKYQPDIIVHTACCYGRNNEGIIQIADVNFRMGLVIIDAILRSGKPTFFFNIDTVLSRNINLYSRTKGFFSTIGRDISNLSSNELTFINLMMHTIYGPRQTGGGVVSDVIKNCLANAPEILLTSGQQKRDFIYIADAVTAIENLIRNIDHIHDINDIEIGSGENYKLEEVLNIIKVLTRSTTLLRFGEIPYRENEVMELNSNISNLKNLGWEPKFDIVTGIEATINGMKAL